MIDDNLLPFCFPAVRRKKITAAFDGGRISSDGGVMLLAQADHRLRNAQRPPPGHPDCRAPGPGAPPPAHIPRAPCLATPCRFLERRHPPPPRVARRSHRAA